MPPLTRSVAVTTGLFEHTEVKSHFINPCCFGEDFARWLRTRMEPLEGYQFDNPIQEDYGWGFWVKHAKGMMWISIGYTEDGPTEGPATWVVSVDWQDPDLLRRWFRKPDQAVFETLAVALVQALKSEPDIQIEDAP